MRFYKSFYKSSWLNAVEKNEFLIVLDSSKLNVDDVKFGCSAHSSSND